MAVPLRLDDGFQTIIHFEIKPTLAFYEIEVTPPGMSAGGPNDTTNMRNKRLRTMSPKKLKSLTPITATVMYRSDVFDPSEVWEMLGVNDVIHLEQPDNSFIQFWGWLDNFTPGPNREGGICTATITIIPSNQNNDSPPVEVDPQYVAPVDVTPPAPFYDYPATPTPVPASGD